MSIRQRAAVIAGVFALLSLLWGAGCSPAPPDPQVAFDQQIRSAADSFAGGNLPAADAALVRAVRMLGGESGAYVEVGKRLLARGRAAEAVRFLDAAVKRAELGWDPLLWATLAEARRRAGDDGGARTAEGEAARRAEQIKNSKGRGPGGDAAAVRRWLQLGTYYHDVRKDTAAALDAWREALKLSPGDPILLNMVGYTLADEGTLPEEFQEALVLTRRALQQARSAPLPSAVPQIQDSYGWALFKTYLQTGDDKHLKAARRELSEAADAAPNEPEIRYHLGVVYAHLGLIEQADNELTRALRLRPDYPEAREAKRQLRKPPGQGVVEGA